jgi:hypothetical protein
MSVQSSKFNRDIDRLQKEKEKKLLISYYNQFAKLFSAKPVIYNDYKNVERVKPSLHIDVRAALIPDFGLRGLTPKGIGSYNFSYSIRYHR